MNDPVTVRRIETIGHLYRHFQCIVQTNRTSFQPARKRFSLEMLHDQKVDPILEADVVQGANVWMIQSSNRLRLSLEAMIALWIGCELVGNNLDCYRSVEPAIAGFVHLAHST